MKYKVVIMLCLLAVLAFTPVACADTVDELQDNVNEGVDNIDFNQVDEIANGLFDSVADKVKDIVSGNFDSAEDLWSVVLEITTSSVADVTPQLIVIFVVMLIVGLTRHLSGGIISQSTDSVISFVGIAVILTSILSLIVGIYKQLYQTFDAIGVLSDASMPILLTLLIANGGTVLSGVCQPSMIMFSSVVIKLVTALILPLSMFAMIFAVVGNISDDVKVNKMSEFFNSAASWIIGVVFMLFSAFTSVQGISAATIDGVSYRAAKFATKSYIPILGGYLADGFDIVVASTSLIKNAFGAVALLILLFQVIKPIVAILVINLGLQGVSAMCEPFVNEKYTKILGGMSKTLSFLAVLVIAVAFMFAILVLIAICCANMV